LYVTKTGTGCTTAQMVPKSTEVNFLSYSVVITSWVDLVGNWKIPSCFFLSNSPISIYSWLPITQTFKGNQKRLELSGVWVIRGWDSCWHYLSHVFSQGQLTCFVHQNTRKLKKLTQRTIRHFKTTMLLNFSKINSKYTQCMEYGVCFVSLHFDKRVRVIKGKITKQMTWREQEFTSSLREVWVIKSLSYWG